jgi:hypothetical protein
VSVRKILIFEFTVRQVRAVRQVVDHGNFFNGNTGISLYTGIPEYFYTIPVYPEHYLLARRTGLGLGAYTGPDPLQSPAAHNLLLFANNLSKIPNRLSDRPNSATNF